MPSVVVSWNGQCRDRDVQKSLCSKMTELGEVSLRLFNDFFGAELKNTHYDCQVIPGKTLLSDSLFHKQSIPSNLVKMDENSIGVDRVKLFGEGYPSLHFGEFNNHMFVVDNVKLFGIEFVLFDPRKFNSPFTLANNDKMSFVFLHSEEIELDGRMVQVGHLLQDRKAEPSGFNGYLLMAPELDLRYYLEHWIGEFLGWVKHFYVPNLAYWAWGDNPSYSGYEQYAPDDHQARDEIFLYLRDRFIEEAEYWKAYCREYMPKKDSGDQEANWAELEDEHFQQRAREEKRQRNRGT